MNPPVVCIGADSVWRQWRSQKSPRPAAPILFLDRDGVIVEEVNYLHRVHDIRFIPGAAETLKLARLAGWTLVVVTNQAGIGKGYYDWNEFAAVNEVILDWLDERGAIVDAVLAVAHHPDGKAPYRHPAHHMRKPCPGMLFSACEKLGGDLNASVIVGDNFTDLAAGLRGGLPRGFHVLTGHGKRYRSASEALASSIFEVQVISDIADLRLRRALSRAGGTFSETKNEH